MRIRLAVLLLLFAAVPLAAQLQILGQDPVVVPATSRDGAIVTFGVPVYEPRDPDSVVVSCEPKSGSLFPLGGTDVFCVATNSFGERAEGGLYVYVYDGESPLLQLPDRIVVKAENKEGAVVTYTARAFDSIDGEVQVSCDPASGSRFPIGVTTVDCVAYDKSLNPGYGSFEVEVQGDRGEELVVVVPDDMTVEATGNAGTNVKFTVTASGTKDPNPTVTCDPPSGATFGFGTTIVVCEATDSFGNHAKGQFEVTVVDTTPPALLLPPDVTAEANGGRAIVEYQAGATDVVDGTVPVTCTPPSGTQFPVGDTRVQCSATDANGNTATGSFVVHVVDRIPPQIASISATPSTLSPPNHKLVDVTVSVEAMDDNDPMPQCFVTTVTANEPIDDVNAADADWILTGPLTLQLRAERSGGHDRVYRVNVSCSDDSGNETGSSVDVTVPQGNGESTSGSATTGPPPTPAPTKKRAVGRG